MCRWMLCCALGLGLALVAVRAPAAPAAASVDQQVEEAFTPPKTVTLSTAQTEGLKKLRAEYEPRYRELLERAETQTGGAEHDKTLRDARMLKITIHNALMKLVAPHATAAGSGAAANKPHAAPKAKPEPKPKAEPKPKGERMAKPPADRPARMRPHKGGNPPPGDNPLNNQLQVF